MKSKDNKIEAMILCGGKSRRMGKDKAFLTLEGKPLIELIIEEIKPLFSKIRLITNTPILYSSYNLEIISDIVPYQGPLGGIYTGLSAISGEYSFVIACDTPLVNKNLIKYMIAHKKGYEAVVVEYKGEIQPLYGIYSRYCLPYIEKLINKGDFRLKSLLSLLNKYVVSEGIVKRYDKEGYSFININSPQDYVKIREIFNKESR